MNRLTSAGGRYNEIPAFAFSPGNILAWQFLGVLATLLCVLACVFQYFGLTYAVMVLTYLLFPASIGMLALLVYTRRYTAYAEVRLLAIIFAWMVFVVLVNSWRVDAALSSSWFHTVCVATFLCFSIPYAFRFEDAKKVLTALSVVLVIAVSLLSAAALFYALTGRVGVSPFSADEVFGIGSDHRLRMFCHPNTVAPICGAAIVLIGYLLIKAKRLLMRIAWIVCLVLCYSALALTDSRAGIVSTALALGFELFLVLNVALLRRRNASLRILLSLFLSFVFIFAFYWGTVFIRTGCSHIIEAQTVTESVTESVTETAAADTATETADAEDAAAAAETAAPEDTESASSEEAISSRGLSNAITFNARTGIWLAVLKGLMGQRRILAFGTTPLVSGEVMAEYFPEGSPVGNFHNSLLAILIAFGIPGLILVLAFIALLFVACARLSFRNMRDAGSLSTRIVPAVVIFALAESMMESFLFTGSMPNIVWIWFMIAAGYIFRSRRSDVAAVSACR